MIQLTTLANGDLQIIIPRDEIPSPALVKEPRPSGKRMKANTAALLANIQFTYRPGQVINPRSPEFRRLALHCGVSNINSFLDRMAEDGHVVMVPVQGKVRFRNIQLV